MSRKYDIFLMIINAMFVIINAIFVAFGSSPMINLIAAIWCMASFAISLNHYINGDKNGK